MLINSSYFKGLNINEETLLQDDDKKEIIPSKAAKIGENADLIFNIIKNAENNYNKITKTNKERKTEGSDQEGMRSAFEKMIIGIKKKSEQLSHAKNKL